MRTKLKNLLLNLLLLCFSLLIALAICEFAARALEPTSIHTGKISYQQHDTLGFMASPGSAVMKTHEFEASWNVNKHGMNDAPIERSSHIKTNRIMVVGDSHTFAIGVSHDQTWPNLLEGKLFEEKNGDGTVFNCSSVGYSLSQYLLKYRQMKNILNPELLIIGFSMATDLYDLIPPSRGGFVYGSMYGRVYHDLDANGELVEKYDLAGKRLDEVIEDANQLAQSGSSKSEEDVPHLFKKFLGRNFALYRMLKTSKFAMWIATHYSIGGKSLWPGLDTCLKIDLSNDDQYRWDLAKKLISQIAKEAHRDSLKVILVNIPYLAVVYDDVWDISFGSREGIYDRNIASKRIDDICTNNNIYFFDSTPLFVSEMKNREEWLHFHHDKHPTGEGHEIIAQGLENFITEKNLLIN